MIQRRWRRRGGEGGGAPWQQLFKAEEPPALLPTCSADTPLTRVAAVPRAYQISLGDQVSVQGPRGVNRRVPCLGRKPSNLAAGRIRQE